MISSELLEQGGGAWDYYSPPFAAGLAVVFVCRFAIAIWGWKQGREFDRSRFAIRWNEAWYRHLMLLLILLITVGGGLLSFYFLPTGKAVAYSAGATFMLVFALPADALVLLFKLWSIRPPGHQANVSNRPPRAGASHARPPRATTGKRTRP